MNSCRLVLKFTNSKLKQQLRLYAVTDNRWTGRQTLMQQIEAALQGGITMLQLREKQMNSLDFLAEAKLVKNLSDIYNVPLIINDNLDVACQSDAAGLHIGQDDGSIAVARQKLGDNKILGVSAQTVEQAQAAEAAGADYLGVGAIFTTNTKDDALTLNLEALKAICQAVKIPVVAIGGITAQNIHILLDSGIVGVAVVSAILAPADITTACQTLLHILEKI